MGVATAYMAGNAELLTSTDTATEDTYSSVKERTMRRVAITNQMISVKTTKGAGNDKGRGKKNHNR